MAKKTNFKSNGNEYFRVSRTIGHRADGTPIRKQFYGAGIKEANQKADEYMNNLKMGLTNNNQIYTINTLLPKWLFSVKKVEIKPTSFESYESTYRNYIKPYLIADLPIKDLKSLKVQEYYNKLLADNISASNIKKSHKLLRQFFDYSEREGYILKNPCSNVALPKNNKSTEKIINERKTKFQYFNEDEIEELLKIFKDTRYYNIILFALGTGMRKGEILGLQWSDIDFENKIIHVNGTLKYIAKAKVKYMIDEPKSESSKRDILMLDNLVTVLREHRKRQLATRMLLGDKWRPEPGFENLVFTGSFGRCISENALYQDMKKIIVQIREDGHTFGEHTPHSLRHTFATRGFERGIPPKVMQEILGHKSITMTLDIYSHVLPDKKAEEINKLAAMF